MVGKTRRELASVGTDAEIQVNAPLGFTRYVLRVEDATGSSDVDGMSVVVEDTVSPAFATLEVDGCLWPPNHRMRLLRLGEEIEARVIDECDGELSNIRIVSVESNEASNGVGDGNTSEDIVFGGSAVCVRAERAGPGSGRNYTVTFEAIDGAGNAIHDTVDILVSHDRRPTQCAQSAAPEVDDDDPRCLGEEPSMETASEILVFDGDPFDNTEHSPDADALPGDAFPGAAATARPEAPGCSASFSRRGLPPTWTLFVLVFLLVRRRRL